MTGWGYADLMGMEAGELAYWITEAGRYQEEKAKAIKDAHRGE